MANGPLTRRACNQYGTAGNVPADCGHPATSAGHQISQQGRGTAALGAGCARPGDPMQHEIVIFLIALSIMLPAAFGIMLVHHDVLLQPDGLGVGMSVFALIGTLMLFLRQ